MSAIRTIPHNPALTGLAKISSDIIYSHAGGKELTMRVMMPWRCDENAAMRYPLILFIQGSSWKFPDINMEIPQLAWYARHGYVVATVTHRNCEEGFPFPAFLEDVKCALRYLRAHAEDWKIDPARVTAFGTSSGGNTALLLGMTGDDPRYKTNEYSDQSDAVQAVVECFGPTDMFALYEYYKQLTDSFPLIEALLDGAVESEKALANARLMSPLCIAEEGRAYPPTMILHGDCDTVVPYESQGVRMFEKLTELGCDTEMIRVEGADHEGSFWSDAVHEAILAFIERTIKNEQ